MKSMPISLIATQLIIGIQTINQVIFFFLLLKTVLSTSSHPTQHPYWFWIFSPAVLFSGSGSATPSLERSSSLLVPTLCLFLSKRKSQRIYQKISNKADSLKQDQNTQNVQKHADFNPFTARAHTFIGRFQVTSVQWGGYGTTQNVHILGAGAFSQATDWQVNDDKNKNWPLMLFLLLALACLEVLKQDQ